MVITEAIAIILLRTTIRIMEIPILILEKLEQINIMTVLPQTITEAIKKNINNKISCLVLQSSTTIKVVKFKTPWELIQRCY